MADLVFFYGTLMTPFNRQGRRRIDRHLRFTGRGTIRAALFDLGIYPAAIPAPDGQVWGEVYAVVSEPGTVLEALDEIEGYCPDMPDTSLYRRKKTPVALDDGRVASAWAYLYNAPLGGAARIVSGDYLEYLQIRPDRPGQAR